MKTLASSTINNNTISTTSTSSSTNNSNSTVPTIIPKVEIPDVTIIQQQFTTPTTTVGNSSAKRPASLDLNKTQIKKSRGLSSLHLDMDLGDGKVLNTPDVEKFILSSNITQTPQPGLIFPTKVGSITREQEAFGQEFEKVLNNLHNSESQTQLNTSSDSTTTTVSSTSIAGTGMSGGTFTYTNLENTTVIKDEPQNPASPPVSPIDMANQERIKLERKRQRNRVAASKCRKRKLERISRLEDKVKVLKGENADLGHIVKSLKDQVAQLKQEVIAHVESGCSIPNIFGGNSLLHAK